MADVDNFTMVSSAMFAREQHCKALWPVIFTPSLGGVYPPTPCWTSFLTNTPLWGCCSCTVIHFDDNEQLFYVL